MYFSLCNLYSTSTYMYAVHVHHVMYMIDINTSLILCCMYMYCVQVQILTAWCRVSAPRPPPLSRKTHWTPTLLLESSSTHPILTLQRSKSRQVS